MKNIAVFASGGGSNAQEIINHFQNSEKGTVSLIVTNNDNAKVIDRAQKHEIPFYILSKGELEEEEFSDVLLALEIDFVVLAGFLKKIPADILENYNQKIINIHPALLPKFGGKGMYGMNVHKAVVEAKETESGMTIHYVNGAYDEGNIIEQHKVDITENDKPEDVAKKVLNLEHKYFAKCVESLL